MKILHCRVDERLIHGRVINLWVKYYRPSHLVVVNDELVKDEFRRLLSLSLLPTWVSTKILSVGAAADFLKENLCCSDEEKVVILAKNPEEFLYLYRNGIEIERVTLAAKFYSNGKLKLTGGHIQALRILHENGVEIVGQDSPEDAPVKLL